MTDPIMSPGEFKRIWDLLNTDVRSRSSCALSDFNEAGILGIADKLRDELRLFRRELVARAKAQYANHAANEACLKDAVGAAVYAEIEPNYAAGLDFGDKP